MAAKKADFGLVGLAVMGENLILNIESRGYTVAVFNRTTSKVTDFVNGRAKGKKIIGCMSFKELAASLQKPKKIILMVKAGQPVDDMVAGIKPYLEPGDIIFDGGNSFFRDTERREAELAKEKLHFIGSGVSGGEEGALKGPSIMPGGPKEAYAAFEPMLKKIAAQVASGPCVTYIGPRGAGHFVKMVHNGIEYGDMELISETYNIMKQAGGLSAGEMAKIFEKWNQGVLSSYLIEITAKVLAYNDPDTGKALVDVIVDSAGQKGTGKWTSQTALDLGVPIPTIDAAVCARYLSAFKDERVKASKVLAGPKPKKVNDVEKLLKELHDALYTSKIMSYAQGMALLRVASQEYGYDLTLSEMARIWEGGCIIRAALLGKISNAFKKNPQLPNLLMDGAFTEIVNAGQCSCRYVTKLARDIAVPTPAFNASLDWYDAYRAERVPANMIQGLRDFFGAHTYKRIDKEGTFHTEWMEVYPG